MIRLYKNFSPIKLNPLFVKCKSEEFLRSAKNVWNIHWLKDALLQLSNYKCAYCECSLTSESNYMEVEHFEDKKNNPFKVIDWNNLLPSCKRCNGAKGTHNVINNPIINPFCDLPSEHLYIKLYIYRSKSLKGEETIDVLRLNDQSRLVLKRFNVGSGLIQLLENALRFLQLYKDNPITKNKNNLMGIVEDILISCQSDREYSATCSTVLHDDEKYPLIKNEMTELGIWEPILEELHEKSLQLVLDKQ